VTVFARWVSVGTSAHIYAARRDVEGNLQSHSAVREGSPDIPQDGIKQDAAYGLRRICLPRTPVNKDKERKGRSYAPRSFGPSSCSCLALLWGTHPCAEKRTMLAVIPIRDGAGLSDDTTLLGTWG
jgi:hypothetical protein